ncbi:hypothetical protein [Nocardia higoensis]|uniref:hypothetical protein n=1 Tax=Nocardia higoensis TaxID=228599 RepID=UPI0002D2CA89|nr:hypothetical protein [Nocardia higoensis]
MDSDSPGNGTDGGLNTAERAELDRLRAEVAALRAAAGGAPPPPPPRLSRQRWRWAAVALLSVLVAVLAITSVLSRYIRSEILDTDRYVATVAPLATNPALQSEISTRITDAIFERVDVEGLTADALAAVAESVPAAQNRPRIDRAIEGLAPVIDRQARDFVDDTVRSFVHSDQFQDLWVQANRTAHAALVRVATGQAGPESVDIDESGTVTLSLGPMIEEVGARLVDRGFTFAEKIPAVDRQFVLFRSPELVRAQRAVDNLDKAAGVLPWLTIAAAVAAIVVAPGGRRRRALAFAGLAIAVGMLVLASALLITRAVYLDRIPPDVLSPGAADAIITTMSTPLRTSLRAVAVLGGVIALAAYLTGASASAAMLRREFGRGMDAVSGLRRSRPPGAWQVRLHRFRNVLRWSIVAVAAALLVFWSYPTGMVVVWTVLGALLALLALEVLIRPARTEQDPAPAGVGAP